MMDEMGYQIGNVDATILAERPKMAPHIISMRTNISNALHCDIEDVSIKATRGEKLGFVGNEEGIVSLSVCILEKKDESSNSKGKERKMYDRWSNNRSN